MVQNAWSWGGPAFWQLEKGGPGNVFKAANHLAITMSSPKPTVLADIYSRLNITLEVPSWHGILFLHDFMCAFIVITCKNNNKQYGVACPAGAEKVIRGIRSCIQEHWKDDNFTVCKVDMSNAFNLVSRQALLEEYAVHLQELLPWVGWCYGSHPTLWHPLGQLSSETGVQQGDPLGPLLFSLVLHKLVLSIAQDKDCLSLLSNRWYLDDGVLSGHSQAVTRAVTLIQGMGPSLGLFINVLNVSCLDMVTCPPSLLR